MTSSHQNRIQKKVAQFRGVGTLQDICGPALWKDLPNHTALGRDFFELVVAGLFPDLSPDGKTPQHHRKYRR